MNQPEAKLATGNYWLLGLTEKLPSGRVVPSEPQVVYISGDTVLHHGNDRAHGLNFWLAQGARFQGPIELAEVHDPLLGPGRYEVAILYHGKDNVIVQTDKPMTGDQIRDLARARWDDSDTDTLGNEWEEINEIRLIGPVPIEEAP